MKYVTSYSEITKTTFRGFARGMALDVLSNISAVRRNPPVNCIQFVYLHHVFSDEESALRRLLPHLSAQYEFISYSEAVSRLYSGDIDKPYMAFSTDDGFKNNLVAARIFTDFGIAACFFICPGITGEQNYERVASFCRDRLHLPPVEFLNWTDIARLQRAGHEIGSHTMSHINLAAAEPAKIAEELERSRDILRENTGEVRHFAYPYGRYFHVNRQVVDAVFKAGYASCASAERGCHVVGEPAGRRPVIRRDQVVLKWKQGHIDYFLSRNKRNPMLQGGVVQPA